MVKILRYRNKIDEMLRLTEDDVQELADSSRTYRQRLKQRARWAAHLERKKAA